MRSFAHLTLVLLVARCAASQAFASGVILLSGGPSAPNRAERNYARVVTRRLDLWLNELAVGHDVVEEEDLNGARLARAQLVILGYNPHPPKNHLAMFEAFVKRGGKLIVFYAAEPRLATMLGMKLGAYKSASESGGLSGMLFNKAAPPNLPAEVAQDSRNIRPVYPAAQGAAVIAHWVNAGGQVTVDPACVMSRRGAWVTHVLLDDRDTWNKKRLLIGLLGHYEPSVWAPAARAALASAGRWGSYDNVEEAIQGIGRAVTGTPREEAARARLAQAEVLHALCLDLLKAGRYPDGFARSHQVRDLLLQAYGCAQESRRGEFRGVWEHSGTGPFPGNWDQTCRVLREHGITDLFVNVLGDGWAHYETRVLSRSNVFQLYGDQLALCTAAARKHGIRVHVWKLCWRVENAPVDWLSMLRKTGRLQVTDTGETINWLCPAHVENLKQEKDSIREILGRYDVDGIHLDYIRYPNGHSCYCSNCRRSFEAAIGKRLARWPSDVLTGSLKKDYTRWRRDRITRLVADVSAFARKRQPAIRISASVYGRYPLCVDSVGQDWGQWLREGYVDFVCPMNYTDDLKRFRAWTLSQIMLPSAKGRVYPGIGVTATESRLGPAEVIDQIAALRKLGAGGFALFDLDRVLTDEILPVLSLGTTAEP